MKARLHPSSFSVLVEDADVIAFNGTWPCSSIRPVERTYVFARTTGDLIDIEGEPFGEDGAEALALSEDAMRFGAQDLSLELCR